VSTLTPLGFAPVPAKVTVGRPWNDLRVAAKSIALFVVAAVCEIGGAYLMWQAIKEERGLLFGLAGAAALVGYGAVAALQPEAHFGRVLAAYGGVFIAGSLLWGIVFDGFRPDRYDLVGAGVALVGVAIIMYSPR
jgi:small multidrug resistance family-3 protein